MHDKCQEECGKGMVEYTTGEERYEQKQRPRIHQEHQLVEY